MSNIPPKQHTIPAYVLPNDSEDLLVNFTTTTITSNPTPTLSSSTTTSKCNAVLVSILILNALDFTIKMKNALHLAMVRVVVVVVVVVVRRWRVVSQPISPHYRSEGRRQGSCAVLGGCLTLSADLARNIFTKF